MYVILPNGLDTMPYVIEESNNLETAPRIEDFGANHDLIFLYTDYSYRLRDLDRNTSSVLTRPF